MNLDIYTTEMSKSVWDKAFFMDKIPGVKCVIDFGCADGAMIRFLAPLFPDMTFVGYDINRELIDRGKFTTPFYPNVCFVTGINAIKDFITMKGFTPDELCINFSSVLHEVYSSTHGLVDIQFLISTLQPRYITIRDMYCDEPLPIINYDEWYQVWGPLPAGLCDQFMATFGRVENWKDTTHLLMKLQWVDNGWDQEMRENYYAWTIDQFIKDISVSADYIPAFECRYQLPYLSEKWKNEYGWYNPDIHTHAQFILRRND